MNNNYAGNFSADLDGVPGEQALLIRTDVAEANSVDTAVREALTRFGKIDILCNHAGTIIVNPFLDMTEKEWTG